MIQKIKEFWFLLGLVLIFIAVIADNSGALTRTGLFFKENYAHEIIIFIIFTVSGLLIEQKQVIAGIKDIKSTLLALTIIIIIAPLTALMFSLLPLETAVVTGFFILSVMPTTLSSGVVMTDVAGGNMAHSLFITITSNIIGIVSIPVILSFLLSCFNSSKLLIIDQGAIIIKLVFLVLVPLMIGIFAKPLFFKMVHIRKSWLQIINQCMVIIMVFISLAGAKNVLTGNVRQLFFIIFLVAVFHLILLGVSFLFIKLSRIKKGHYESIIFMGSQKTLPLSIMIQVTYFEEYQIAALVLIMHHIVHLMIDGALSVRMGKKI